VSEIGTCDASANIERSSLASGCDGPFEAAIEEGHILRRSAAQELAQPHEKNKTANDAGRHPAMDAPPKPPAGTGNNIPTPESRCQKTVH